MSKPNYATKTCEVHGECKHLMIAATQGGCNFSRCTKCFNSKEIWRGFEHLRPYKKNFKHR